MQERFSDDKRFCVWNDGPVKVWRREGERFRQGKTLGCVKHSKSIMMHLTIASSGESKLVLCESPQYSEAYQRVVVEPILPFIRHRSSAARIRDPIVFMQDGASCHFLFNPGVHAAPGCCLAPELAPQLTRPQPCRALLGMDKPTVVRNAVPKCW